MGSSPPCPIIPTPRRMLLTATSTPWPGGMRIEPQAPDAEPHARHFESLCRLRGGEKSLPIRLIVDAGLPAEAYVLDLKEDTIDVVAATGRGFQYAAATLLALAHADTMPLGRIEDAPRLALRGFHLNLESYRRIGIDVAIQLLEIAARLKLNTALVEYGPRFPFPSGDVPCDSPRWTPEDIAHLNDAAARLNLDLIPLQQSMAHLEYLLRHNTFAPLRENPERDNLICPSNPHSIQLVQALAREVIQAHPSAKHLHIGGDEARKVGQCEKCAAAVKADGVGALYGRYMGDLARWTLEQGRRPIVWDDTVCTHPDALAHLPKETIIAYWDYIAVADPTPVLIPRMAHAAGGPRVAHHWSWLSPWRRTRISDVQADVMRDYSRPCNLKTALGAAYLREFGPHLGDGFPTWVRALPYLEYYRDKGFEVICCPTGMGNGDTRRGLPNFARFAANIRTHGVRAAAAGASGVITTAWYDMPPEVLTQAMILTAQQTWSGDGADVEVRTHA